MYGFILLLRRNKYSNKDLELKMFLVKFYIIISICVCWIGYKYLIFFNIESFRVFFFICDKLEEKNV